MGNFPTTPSLLLPSDASALGLFTLPTSQTAIVPFSWADWGNRIRLLFPRPWAGDAAWTLTGDPASNGRMGSIARGLAGGVQAAPSGLPFIYQQLVYAKLQTRMLTITDTNVDQVGLDWFGGVIPRISGQLGIESDRAYASRLVLTLTAGCPSIPGLETVLQAYLDVLLALAAPVTSLGADTSGAADTGQGAADVVQIQANPLVTPVGPDVATGAADTRGFTDVGPTIGLGVPTVVVFDRTSDPNSSALISLTDPYFAVFLDWPNASTSLIRRAQSITPAFDAIVRAFKAPGTFPVYCTNGPS